MMKKIMWGISLIPFIVTGIVLQFFPDTIPMHYDLEGNIDRWGNKAEQFIFPISILIITGFWNILISHYERKSKAASTEKEATEAISNGKLLCIVGISQAAMFGIMHFFGLYGSYIEANTGLSHAAFDIGKISCILGGIVFVILGNFLPKAKKNSAVGVRTAWSMYNDNTWRKSNRFGAISLIVAGLLTILTTIFTSGMISTVMLIVYLIISSIITILYSKIVYEQEKKMNK